MSIRPSIRALAAVLADAYGIHHADTTLLPGGADADACTWRVDAPGRDSRFLKASRRGFPPAAMHAPAWLRHVCDLDAVVAPLPTVGGEWSAQLDGFHWALYPLIEGEDGFIRRLDDGRWEALGRTVRAMHDAVVPDALRERLHHEDFSLTPMLAVRRLHDHIDDERRVDALGARFLDCWRTHRRDIARMLRRVGTLAPRITAHPSDFVLCHADLHAGNVIATEAGGIAIVDWDGVQMAPRERDLMFVGAGVGGQGADIASVDAFQRGYGGAPVDAMRLCWYRHARIVVDLGEFAAIMLNGRAPTHEREAALVHMEAQFTRGNVVERADACHAALGQAVPEMA